MADIKTPEIVSPSIEENLLKAGFKPTEKKVETPAPINNAPASEEGKVVTTTPATTTPANTNTATEQIDYKAELEKAKAELEKYKTAEPKVIEKILTPEEILAREQAEKNEFTKWVVTDKNIKPSLLERFETVMNQPAKDYIYAKYKEQAKKDNPDMDDSEIEMDFNTEYGLGSGNEKKEERAINRIELEAKEDKNKEFKDFFPLKDQFKAHKEVTTKLPVYKSLVESSKPEIKVSLPSELFGLKEAIEIDVDYSDIKDELIKELKDPEVFKLFTAEGVDTEKAINHYISQNVKERKQNEIVKSLVEKAYTEKVKEIKLGSVAPSDTKTGSKVENVSKPGWEDIAKKIDEYGIK